jgi:hypothetical protein
MIFVTSLFLLLLAQCPTRKLEDHPLSFVRGCLFNVFAASLHSWRPFLHPQPEDAPCCGDRDPPTIGVLMTSAVVVRRPQINGVQGELVMS